MSHIDGEPISERHGTAERDVGDTGTEVTAGNASAGSGGNSFEVVPPRYESPPGLTERQRADFEQANRIPISFIPSNNGDENTSEATMAMLKMMQRQMEMQMIMMKRMEDRDEKRKEEEKEPIEKTKWRGVKLDIKHFSRIAAFNGEHCKFRDWLFGVNTVIGTIDQKLC